MHLVGFNIQIYHDARSHERQILKKKILAIKNFKIYRSSDTSNEEFSNACSENMTKNWFRNNSLDEM